MPEQTLSNRPDDASMDLGRAWGLSFLCASVLNQVKGESSDEERARHLSAAGALQHIAALSKSAAEQLGEAPAEVKNSVWQASGVAAVVAREAFIGPGLQYREDITDWAVDAVTQALESAKQAVDEWIELTARNATGGPSRDHQGG